MSSLVSPLFSILAVVAAVLPAAASAIRPSAERATEQATLQADPPVHEIVRMLTPLCSDRSPQCELRKLKLADAYGEKGLSFVVIARDEKGRDYALMQRNLRSRTSATPQVWVFKDLSTRPASQLWRVDCAAGSYVPIVKLLQDARGSVLSHDTRMGTYAKPTVGSAPQRLIKAICEAPIAIGYTHL